MKKLLLLIIAALAIGSASTINITGGLYSPLSPYSWDTLVAGDSAKTPYLRLWGDRLAGYCFISFYVKQAGSDNIKIKLCYEYGNDTLNMNRVTIDSLVAADTVFLDISATHFKPSAYGRFIADMFSASAADTNLYGYQVEFLPLPLGR